MKSFLLVLSMLAPFWAHAEDPQSIQEMLHRGDAAYFPWNDLKPGEMNYREWNPAGERTIIFVHGLGGSSMTWTEIAPYFADAGYRVIAIDQRGHGRTPARGFSFSSTTMANDVKGLMDQLGIQKASLVGHSMGGRTVLRFGQLFPDRTEVVVVEDMHAMGRTKLLDAKAHNLGFYKSVEMKLNQLRPRSEDEAVEELRKIFDPEPWDKWFDSGMRVRLREVRADDGSTYFTIPAENFYNDFYYPQGLQEDLTAVLKAETKPVLFVKASDHPVLWGIGVDHIVETKPGARVVEVSNTHHGIHDSAPREFTSLVRQFIETGDLNLPEAERAARALPRPRFDWSFGVSARPHDMKEIRSGAEGTTCEKSLFKW